jgi:SP family arabinose:H+ symporter-like MFS transporter
MLLVDKIGRKRLMLIGTSLMALFLLLLAWSFNSSVIDGKLVLIFVIGYIGTFAFTLGPVVWVLLSEMFPNYIRGKALSLSSGVLWLSTFVVVLVSPSLLKFSPVVNFIIFGACNVIGFFFVWRYVPETKGKSLEEIEKMLTGK